VARCLHVPGRRADRADGDPAELVDRDTFRFFQCDGAMPTALYSYDEAVRDGVLVDFRKSILGAQTHFQIEGIRPS